MRVGVLSDTHGRLDQKIADLFRAVDHIVHAGDIGGEWILAELERIAPVTAVAGNIDGFQCGEAGEEAMVELGGDRIYVRHILGSPNRLEPAAAAAIARVRPAVVVFGHSHLPHAERRDGILFFNPASAGPRRFDYPISIGILEREGKQWRGRHLPLDVRSKAALEVRMNQLSR